MRNLRPGSIAGPGLSVAVEGPEPFSGFPLLLTVRFGSATARTPTRVASRVSAGTRIQMRPSVADQARNTLRQLLLQRMLALKRESVTLIPWNV